MNIKPFVRSSPYTAWLIRWLQQRRKHSRFKREFRQFRQLSDGRFTVNWHERQAHLDDATSSTGFDSHYIFHTAWAARKVKELASQEHVDISSSLYFGAIVSAFVSVRFYDYRPAALGLSQLQSEKADLMHLPFADASLESVSCMHVVEHVGLGRYGDPLDPNGDLIAMSELQRVVKIGGSLLFVVPVGRRRIVYNAHRIYAFEDIVSGFSDLSLQEFSLIPDALADGLIIDADPRVANSQEYGCGCFWFKRSAASN